MFHEHIPNLVDSNGTRAKIIQETHCHTRIVTPYITNLLGKDSNRCQMTRMFFRPDMFLVYVLSFVDEASEGELSTFAVIFRKRFPTLA